jgi:poly(hydroxyalkanoate) depolymerase family esterase
MKKLSATIAQLAAMHPMSAASAKEPQGRLKDLAGFGSNPGALIAKAHVPKNIRGHPALVVVLHGCTQTAAGYDRGSGWSQLADEHGFALLFPEQQRGNNPTLCFNWFSPADTARDRGEALSIRQMIATMVETYDIDASRIFVTGLSAGGAMASILLATYPEVFAGGAIIAGLPYGAASNVSQALEAMRGAGRHSGAELGDRVRRAVGHSGPWPSISIWHGTADATVSDINADAILAQWLSVHGLDGRPSTTAMVGGHPHRRWTDEAGRTVIEDYRITGMGHGTPLATTGRDACGTVMPHMLEVGISSTRRMAATWKLLDGSSSDATSTLPAGKTAQLERLPSAEPAPAAKTDVEKIIEDALRAAGLMP